MANLRLYGFLKESSANGPGIRSVVWVQGCLRGCPGCFNPGSLDPAAGKEYSIEKVLSMIPFGIIEGVTFSGGEPFLQAGAFAELAAEIKARDRDILVYTGYRLEELQESGSLNIEALLKLADILIDGPYKMDNPSLHPWAGSGNQRILKMKKGKAVGQYFAPDGPVPLDSEIHIMEDGTVITTGF